MCNELFGHQVLISEGVQYNNVYLSDEVTVSSEFRLEMNRWLFEQFGGKSTIPDGQVYMFEGKLVMNARTWEELNKYYRRHIYERGRH